MRIYLHTIVIALCAFTFSACNNHKTDTTIIEVKDSVKKPAAPQKMQEYRSMRSVNWHGETYTYNIHRSVDESLPVVKDENGTKFYDNKIDMTVTHNGQSFFSKTFTKSTFSSYLDAGYKEKGILEGLVFDKVNGNCLQFAASVSLPQTDEYIPLVVKLSPDGSISIARDTQMDSGNDVDSVE